MTQAWPYAVILAAAVSCFAASLPGDDNPHQTAKPLIAVLQSDAPTFDKARACQKLTALGDKEAVPALAALLGDEKLAGHARSALESIADPSASAALRKALGQVQGKLLAGVVNSLGVRHDVEAVPALKKLAADFASGVSSEALTALGRIASPEAVDTLRRALTGGSAESRAVAAHACLACAERLVAQGKRPEAISLLDQIREADVPTHLRTAAIYDLILARQSADLALFTAQLQSDDPALFAVALRAARHLPDPQTGAPKVTQVLVAGLDRLSPPRQALVIGALAERNNATAIAAVQKAAAAGPREARSAALRALGRAGDAASTPLLISAALSDDAGMAEAARESLIVSVAEGVDRAIVARLEQAAGKERAVLLDIVGQRGEAAVAVVAKLADDPAREVRLAAIETLGRTVGLENLHLLTGRLQTAKTPEETAAVQQALRAACSRATDPEAYAPKLRDCMPAAPLSGQCFLLELIGQVGGREALAIISRHARDSRPEIRDTATQVLGRWMGVDAAPVLLDLAKTLDDAKLQSRCLRGYLRIARQLKIPTDLRLAMCEEALSAAQRDEEKRLVAEVADIAVKKTGTAAQRARAKAIGTDQTTSLFDGRTLDGWEGDLHVWRVRDGQIVGGSLAGNPQNEFLATRNSYGDFVLRLEYKLVGTAGFVNSGVQFRSVRMQKPANEMYGFQADIGAGHSGCLYDESRRNRFLARATDAEIKRLEKPGGWNSYEVRCAGAQIQIVLNGEKTVDYIEADPAIPRSGLIGLQMHGGNKAEVSFRNITLEEMSYAAAKQYFGIGKGKWKVASFSSENTEGEDERAVLAIDDDPATFWHTQWNGAQPGHPHHLAVDMGEQVEVSGFTYLPRQDGRQGAGVIGEYEFYVSRDGKQWNEPVARGRFENIESDPRGRVVLLKKPAAGRYFKIVSLSAPGSEPYAGAAEIGVLGKPSRASRSQ
jgi:HEAT repeat protein